MLLEDIVACTSCLYIIHLICALKGKIAVFGGNTWYEGMGFSGISTMRNFSPSQKEHEL